MKILEGSKQENFIDKRPDEDRVTQTGRMDDKGPGGAFHKYIITDMSGKKLFAGIDFQKGPIKEGEVNGCSNEDLIMIVVDRLACFQEGEFPCDENRIALALCEQLLNCLLERTLDRKKRGVEGKSEA